VLLFYSIFNLAKDNSTGQERKAVVQPKKGCEIKLIVSLFESLCIQNEEDTFMKRLEGVEIQATLD
jgi:hypothetical protein